MYDIEFNDYQININYTHNSPFVCNRGTCISQWLPSYSQRKKESRYPKLRFANQKFDMKPYMVKKTLADITFLKFCFRDDTCWNSLDAETQSYIYKGIPKTIDDIIFNSTDKKRDDICNRHHNLCNLDKRMGWHRITNNRNFTSIIRQHTNQQDIYQNKLQPKKNHII